ITDLAVAHGNSDKVAAPAGFTKIGVDLNKGAGGEFIYLCYRKGGTTPPIDGLTVIFGRDAQPKLPFVKIDVDLNKGAGSATPFIWLCYKRSGSREVAENLRFAL